MSSRVPGSSACRARSTARRHWAWRRAHSRRGSAAPARSGWRRSAPAADRSGMLICSSICEPIERSSRLPMPRTRLPRSVGTTSRSCRRAKASRRCVSAAPRCAPCTAPSTSRVARGSTRHCLRSNSRLPSTAIRRLLKSCATPPVSWPIISVFCTWRSCSSVRLRCSISASTTAWAAFSSAVRSATRVSSTSLRPRISSSALRRAVTSLATPTSRRLAPLRSNTMRARSLDPAHRAIGPDGAILDGIIIPAR